LQSLRVYVLTQTTLRQLSTTRYRARRARQRAEQANTYACS
jgi:hypothetical protein